MLDSLHGLGVFEPFHQDEDEQIYSLSAKSNANVTYCTVGDTQLDQLYILTGVGSISYRAPLCRVVQEE